MQGHRTSGTSDTRFFTFLLSSFASLGAVITSDAIHSKGQMQEQGKCRTPGGTSGARARAQDFRDVHPQILHFSRFYMALRKIV